MNRDVRSINQPATQQYTEIPSFPDELEVIVSNIECRLLESLTPQQFTMVQHLMDGRGKLEPHDRSDRTNGFLNWTGAARTDNPANLAAALDQSGITLSQFCDL